MSDHQKLHHALAVARGKTFSADLLSDAVFGDAWRRKEIRELVDALNFGGLGILADGEMVRAYPPDDDRTYTRYALEATP